MTEMEPKPVLTPFAALTNVSFTPWIDPSLWEASTRWQAMGWQWMAQGFQFWWNTTAALMAASSGREWQPAAGDAAAALADPVARATFEQLQALARVER